MNKFKTPVKHIVVDALDPDLAVDKVNCMLSNDYKFTNVDLGMTEWLVPNSMEGARYAFNADRYVNTCYGLVEDGEDMTIGITSDGVIPHWVIWAEFKLTYMGKNADAVAAVLEAKLDEYSTFVDEQSDNELINSVEKKLADNAIDNAETALGSGDVDKMWDALIAINDAYDHTQKHVALMTETKDVLDELTDAISEYAETASTEAVNEANAILEEGYDELSNEELTSLIAKAKVAIAKLKIPDTSGASEENPIDMTRTIVNNGFETGNLTGWVNEGEVSAQAQNNSSFDNKQGNYYAERWHVNGTVNINQTVSYLPAGYYTISAYVYSSASDAKLFANDEEVEVAVSQLYTVTAVVDESGELKFGVKWTDDGDKWTCLDEFTMQYIGTEAPTGIQEVAQKAADGAQIVAIYTVSGAPVASLQKGLNIVKYADGSVKKIFVK